MRRLFIALSLPDEVRERLSSLGGGVPGARWVAPENLHLTLRFLGEVDNGLARDIDDALHQVDAPPFELRPCVRNAHAHARRQAVGLPGPKNSAATAASRPPLPVLPAAPSSPSF